MSQRVAEASADVRMRIPEQLRCIPHGQPMQSAQNIAIENAESLDCNDGCRIPIINGIPRFVGEKSYADAFGMQWNHFRQTQLDSYTHTTISRDRLTRCLGARLGSEAPDDVAVSAGLS